MDKKYYQIKRIYLLCCEQKFKTIHSPQLNGANTNAKKLKSVKLLFVYAQLSFWILRLNNLRFQIKKFWNVIALFAFMKFSRLKL